jgi:hypothetical protein
VGLENPKSIQANRLEIWVRIDAVVLCKFHIAGRLLEPQPGFLCCCLKAKVIFLKASIFALKAFS